MFGAMSIRASVVRPMGKGAHDIVERAKRLGATVTSPPTTIPNVGTIAVFADPLGASFGILQP